MCLPRTVQKSKQKAETPGPCLPSAALGPWTLWSELPFYFPKYQAMPNICWDVFAWHPVITLACNHWLAGCRRLIWNVLAIAPTPVCFVLMVLNILKPTVKTARIHWWGVPFLLSSLEMLPNIDSLKKKIPHDPQFYTPRLLSVFKFTVEMILHLAIQLWSKIKYLFLTNTCVLLISIDSQCSKPWCVHMCFRTLIFF